MLRSGPIFFFDTLTKLTKRTKPYIEAACCLKIREEKAWNGWKYNSRNYWKYNSKKLLFFSDEENAAKFIEYSKDHLLDGMYWIQEALSIRKERKEKIALTFFPESQTIPNKFFPMTGEEETPYVAIKLHLQDKEG